MSASAAPPSLELDLGEDLCDRLRDLAERYPKGLGLVKEFLQNADDADASFLRVIYDRRQHVHLLPDPAMNVALGPSLLFANDRPFGPEDIKRLHRISDSGKVADAGRTGRFGQGFNTSYSISDHPSLVTNETVIWFDPQRRIQNGQRNAYAWKLSDVAVAWPGWLATFEPAGVTSDGRPFNGAAFRLPLRTPAEAMISRIRPGEPFLPEHFEAIVDEVARFGPALLVFLRSVLKLEISEIDEEGRARSRIRIDTKNVSRVSAIRADLRTAVQGEPVKLLQRWLTEGQPPAVAEYTHEFRVTRAGSTEEVQKWEVVTGIFSGSNNCLIQAALTLSQQPGGREKAIPWAGAAAPRSIKDLVGGGLASFLPLPELGSYPVWLHGWFAVDSARRGLARVSEVDELIHKRVQWNASLMRHGVSVAWTQLLMRLRGAANDNTDPYSRWPRDKSANDEVDRSLWEGFYHSASTLPLFRALGIEYTWTIPDKHFLHIGDAWFAKLSEPVRAIDNLVAAPPLPSRIVDGLTHVKASLRIQTPQMLQEYLKRFANQPNSEWPLEAAPSPILTKKEWILSLAQYCASSGVDKLVGLPLALCLDGKLRQFEQGVHRWVPTNGQQTLARPIPDRLLDPDLLITVLKSQAHPQLGIYNIDCSEQVELMKLVLERGPVDDVWLETVFDLLSQFPNALVTKSAQPLKALYLIPDRKGNNSRMGLWQTPLLPVGVGEAVEVAVENLNISLTKGLPGLVSAMLRFADKHADFIWRLTPEHLVNMLIKHNQAPFLNLIALQSPQVSGPLLDFLSQANWTTESKEQIKKLSGLKWLPTIQGAVVSATEQRVYVLDGFEPPPGIGGALRIIDLGSTGGRRQVAIALGAPTLNSAKFITEVLLPSFSTADSSGQETLLLWLRDEYPSKVERSLDEDTRKRLRREFQQAAILPVASGGLLPPQYVYAPDASTPDEILGSLAPRLDLHRFVPQWDIWVRFFDWLNLPRQPLPHDLLRRIDELVSRFHQGEQVFSTTQLLKVAEHIGERWEQLSNYDFRDGSSFKSALASRKWLPARRMDIDECFAAMIPEDRLYAPYELASYSLRHLIGSLFCFHQGASLPRKMSEALGMTVEASAAQIFKHIDRLSKTVPSDIKSAKSFHSSFREICRYFGRLNEDDLFLIRQELEHLKDEPIIFLNGKFRCPATIIFSRPSVSLPGYYSVSEDKLLRDHAEDHVVRQGLQRLGVRDSISPEDWLIILDQLAATSAERPMADAELHMARAALAVLLGMGPPWIQNHAVWIITADAKLVRPQKAFIPDDPRLKHSVLLSPIPLVEEVDQTLTLARYAGCPSLKGALYEQLRPSVMDTSQPEHVEWRTTTMRKIRSGELRDALRRIVYDDAIRSDEHDPIAVASQPSLTEIHRLLIRVADPLQVGALLDLDRPVVIFDHQPASYLDQANGTIWIQARNQRRMLDELVRAICRCCNISDTLRVSRILAVNAEEMQALLDEEEVATIPIGKTLPNAANILFSNDSVVPGASAEDAWQDTSDAAADNWSTDGATEEGELPVRANPETGVDAQPVTDGDNLGRPSHTPLNTQPYNPLYAIDPDAPRTPGHGRSQLWSAGSQTSTGGRFKERLYTELLFDSAKDTDSEIGITTIDDITDIKLQAIERVRSWEFEQGRSIDSLAPQDSPYDLVTGKDSEQRRIIVRGLDGPWTERGVSISKALFETAQAGGDSFWMYVVEYARDPSRSRILPLVNPASVYTAVRIGSAWKSRVEGDDISVNRPAINDSVELTDGRVAKIIDIEDFEPLFEVTLEFSDGTTEMCTWQPLWKKRT